MSTNVMRPAEVFAGKSGDVYVSLNDTRYHCMHITEIEATVEYEKGDVPMLGRRMTGHKINGMSGSYKGKGYYRFSELREAAEVYKNGGAVPIYEIEISNTEEYDAASSNTAGTQRVVLKDCMPDSQILAKADAGSEFLEEDIEGTFDDFEIVEKFDSSMEGFIES